MKGLKRLVSFCLGICMFVTGIPKVFAQKKTINALVIGTDSSQHKFARILFGEDKKLANYYTFEGNEKDNIEIKMALCLDYKRSRDYINEYIEKNLIEKKEGIKHLNFDFYFKVIIATVDAEQEIEKVKEDMRNIIDYICDYKPAFTQVLIVGCKESDMDIDFCKLSNYTGSIEKECTSNGWGSKHDKSFYGTGQFLNFCSLYDSKKQNFKSTVLELEGNYDFYKKREKKNIFFLNKHKYVILTSILIFFVTTYFCKDYISRFFEDKHKEK